MSDKTIQVVAFLRVKPESKEWVFENVFKKLVEETRKEPGCLKYILHHDIKEPNTFVMLETFKSKEDADVHTKSSHMGEAIKKLKQHFSQPPEIRVIKPLL